MSRQGSEGTPQVEDLRREEMLMPDEVAAMVGWRPRAGSSACGGSCRRSRRRDLARRAWALTMNELGDASDILLADLSYYAVGMRREAGMEVSNAPGWASLCRQLQILDDDCRRAAAEFRR